MSFFQSLYYCFERKNHDASIESFCVQDEYEKNYAKDNFVGKTTVRLFSKTENKTLNTLTSLKSHFLFISLVIFLRKIQNKSVRTIKIAIERSSPIAKIACNETKFIYFYDFMHFCHIDQVYRFLILISLVAILPIVNFSNDEQYYKIFI